MVNYERRQPNPSGMRLDIARAIDALPADIKQEVTELGGGCLRLVNSHLAPNETVQHISSASAQPDSSKTCLLVLTDQRLIFVAPRPQAVAMRLSTISKSQAFSGYFFFNGDAGEYSVGLDSKWGPTFESYVQQAVMKAVLSRI